MAGKLVIIAAVLTIVFGIWVFTHPVWNDPEFNPAEESQHESQEE